MNPPQPKPADWNLTTETFPPVGIELEITHPQFYGTRTAIMAYHAPFQSWLLTDCINSAQNVNVPIEFSAWRHIHETTTKK